MIGFCPLASGSKGNCIYIGSKQTKLLIDVGLSAKALKERLSLLDIDITTIDAILITHEHHDHIKGLETVASRYHIPVLINSDTAKEVQRSIKTPLKFKIFATGESFLFGDIKITTFSIQHDAIDPIGCIIEAEGKRIGFCTDLGIATRHVSKHLLGCHHLYIEANHEPSMVHASNRPPVYKERVLGRQGHLSNDECAKLITEIAHPDLKSIHLAHLSSECNSEELALKKIENTINSLNLSTEILIAYQDRISKQISF
ncbi:MAG: putative metallo-hydrolase yycJ [Chlamydiota bacterium]|jgi:phosphoribosyl 1,2-cyclic phosphodiesterase